MGLIKNSNGFTCLVDRVVINPKVMIGTAINHIYLGSTYKTTEYASNVSSDISRRTYPVNFNKGSFFTVNIAYSPTSSSGLVMRKRFVACDKVFIKWNLKYHRFSVIFHCGKVK